jgi:hypothetical protein
MNFLFKNTILVEKILRESKPISTANAASSNARRRPMSR